MKLLTMMAVLLTAVASYCQEAGYYVTKSGQKVNVEFEKRPGFGATELSVKKPGGGYEKISLSDINEFGVPNVYRMQRFDVDADLSVDRYTKVSPKSEAIFQNRSLFMESLVDGDASLYVYEDGYFTNYFYSVKSKNIPLTQLLHKDFVLASGEAGTNNKFRQQLFENVSCEGDKVSDFTKRNYARKELVEVFNRYNTCKGGGSTELKGSDRGLAIKLAVFAGYSVNKYESVVEGRSGSENFGSPQGGFEVEALFPSKQFSFFGRLGFSKATAEATSIRRMSSSTTIAVISKLDMPYADLYLGSRYYVLSSQRNKLYVDAAASLIIPFNGKVGISTIVNDNGVVTDETSFKLSSNLGFAFAAGYIFNDKWGAEFRYNTTQNLLGDKTPIEGNFSRMSLNVRYTIL